MENKVIVVFGGSFNPPTNAHFSLAQQIIDEYTFIDKILFVPVSDLYIKKGLIPAKYRIEMLKEVCERNHKFDVSTIEVDSPKLLSTIDTLKLIQEEYPHRKIWFTVGTDNLKQMPTWSKYEELTTRFRVLVLERDYDHMMDIIDKDPLLKKHVKSFMKVKESVRSNCSSSILREKLRHNKSIRYLVPDEVYEYVKEYDLFQVDQRKYTY